MVGPSKYTKDLWYIISAVGRERQVRLWTYSTPATLHRLMRYAKVRMMGHGHMTSEIPECVFVSPIIRGVPHVIARGVFHSDHYTWSIVSE